MSSPSNSANSTSESESEASEIDDVVEEIAKFAPYDESVEPLATEEEAAAYNERVRTEEEEEMQFQRRYLQEVTVNEWYGH